MEKIYGVNENEIEKEGIDFGWLKSRWLFLAHHAMARLRGMVNVHRSGVRRNVNIMFH